MGCVHDSGLLMVDAGDQANACDKPPLQALLSLLRWTLSEPTPANCLGWKCTIQHLN